ncbi:thiamine-phosphate kinase [Mycolicibacterium fallax]|uniref:Thiamine-monophosphate kinase n=1 Tax=Mycolicibacterium fallax TaxID=1793 RepID=A0A1X1RI84_MYCFA|nr:thiamine-phosphate kinase [Mycolicibacterium fallax]ORV06790.1 thiamine-monophosphate kinase [Mycolicibacterium fallax]BBY96759.1 thiamine-monophosphate kinase [Mycolicibacterium fallax]
MTEGPTLGELGEFAVIDAITAGRRHGDAVRVGPGDDAAVLDAPDGRVVASTDMLVQGRHFRLDWSSPEQVGRKAIAQNAADIEAMGAVPTGFLVAFGAPVDTPASAVTALSDGLSAEAARAGASIIGGDLVASPQWTVSVTALGDLAGRPAVLRSGASAGDVVAVAGELGRSGAGYALLDAGAAEPALAALVDRHLVPQPPYGQGARAARAGATAMTDVSDGLIIDLRQLAAASGVGIDLHTARLAADRDALTAAAVALGADPWAWIFGGGEDHALVACFPAAAVLPQGWRLIGAVTAEHDGVTVDGGGWTGRPGWDSFG